MRFWISLSLLLLVPVGSTYGIQTEPTPGYMLISGSVQNPERDYVAVATGGSKRRIAIKDGKFSSKLKFDSRNKTCIIYPARHDGLPRVAELTAFYYQPGLELNISFDLENYEESLVISGSGKKYVDFYNEWCPIFERNTFEELKSLKEGEFLKGVKSQLKKEIEFLSQQEALCSDLIEYETEDAQIRYFTTLVKYCDANLEATDVRSELEKFDFSSSEKMKSNFRYRFLVMSYFKFLGKKYAKKESIKEGVAFIDVVNESDIPDIMKEDLLVGHVSGCFKLSPYNQHDLTHEELRVVVDTFSAISKNEELKAKFTKCVSPLLVDSGGINENPFRRTQWKRITNVVVAASMRSSSVMRSIL